MTPASMSPLVALLAIGVFSWQAHAQSVEGAAEGSGDWPVALGGDQVYPHSEREGFGSASFSDINWRDPLHLRTTDGFGVTLFRHHNFAAGVKGSVSAPTNRFAPPGLDDGRQSYGLGFFGGLFSEHWTIAASVGQDLANGQGGFVADLDVKWGSSLSDRLRVEVGPEVRWASEGYMDDNYGLRGRRSGGSGLRLYDPSAGVRDVAIAGSVYYSLSDNWTVGGLVGAQRLLGAAADSPLVRDENQYFGGLSLGYRF